MFKNWLKKQIREAIRPEQDTATIDRAMEGSMPAVIAFRINNGYLLRCNTVDANRIGPQHNGYVYCADEKALADGIVAAHVKGKVMQESRPDMQEAQAEMAMPTVNVGKLAAASRRI